MSLLQFKRRYSLQVLRPEFNPMNPNGTPYSEAALVDLSQLHFQFKTSNQDDEGPANASIRVYNIKRETAQAIIGQSFNKVILQAGYESGFGTIFEGNIKQFREGRLNGTDTYLDLLAADGDLAYNYGIANGNMAAGTSSKQEKKIIEDGFKKYGVTFGSDLTSTGGTLPRGKVLFGMARTFARMYAENLGATWSIQNGQIVVIPRKAYLPGTPRKLNAANGLVGIPQQSTDGIRVRCLIDPTIQIGATIQIDNALINKTINQNPNAAPIPFNQWANPQFLANVSKDGIYRVYVAEYVGDTRGGDWYVDMVCLAVDSSSKKVVGNG